MDENGNVQTDGSEKDGQAAADLLYKFSSGNHQYLLLFPPADLLCSEIHLPVHSLHSAVHLLFYLHPDFQNPDCLLHYLLFLPTEEEAKAEDTQQAETADGAENAQLEETADNAEGSPSLGCIQTLTDSPALSGSEYPEP